MEDREYIFIDDFNILGEFTLHYGIEEDSPQQSCLRPVFKVNKLENNSYKLISGFKTDDNIFYQCPFSIYYIQIDYIDSFSRYSVNCISSKLKIFSKNFEKNRIIDINLSNLTGRKKYKIKNLYNGHMETIERGGRNYIDIMCLNNIINIINVYIDNDNDIYSLDESAFHQENEIKKLNEHDILNAINNLEFKFFSNGQTRVNRDDASWQEIEITNLPSNKYLTRLFSKIVGGFVVSNLYIFVIYDHTLNGSLNRGRRDLPVDEKKMYEIKDLLKLKILRRFKPTKELNERIKIPDPSLIKFEIFPDPNLRLAYMQADIALNKPSDINIFVFSYDSPQEFSVSFSNFKEGCIPINIYNTGDYFIKLKTETATYIKRFSYLRH